MRNIWIGLALTGVLLWMLPVARAEPDRVARGRYLAEGVGVCVDCHTPRTLTGEPDRSRWMLGSELDFKPGREQPWATWAPPLAGLAGLQEQEVVVAYLKSLKR